MVQGGMSVRTIDGEYDSLADDRIDLGIEVRCAVVGGISSNDEHAPSARQCAVRGHRQTRILEDRGRRGRLPRPFGGPQ